MRLLELTLDNLAANLALDEALLLSHEKINDVRDLPVLRLWEPPQPMVVLGRGSQVRDEVHLEACRRQGVPVLRRCSGGATIVTGPGCLMYSLVFHFHGRNQLPAIDQLHNHVLDQLAAALTTDAQPVVRSGTSDLVVDDADGLRKFSGNSLRVRRHCVLYHGTCLYDFPLQQIEQLLSIPPRMPTYRQARPHGSFVRNLPMTRTEIRRRFVNAFSAAEPSPSWPFELTQHLVEQRYSRADWNLGA